MAEEDMLSRMTTNVSPTSTPTKVKKVKIKEAPTTESVETNRGFCDRHPKICMAGITTAAAGVKAAKKTAEVGKAVGRGTVKAGKKAAKGTYKAALIGTVVAEDVLSGDFAITNNALKGYENDLKKSEDRYVSDYEDTRERLTGSRKRTTTTVEEKPIKKSVPKKKSTSTRKKRTTASKPRKTATKKRTVKANNSASKRKTSSKGAGTRKKTTRKKTTKRKSSSSFRDPDYWRI